MTMAGARGQYDAVQGVRCYSHWGSKQGGVQDKAFSISINGREHNHRKFRWGLALTALVLTFCGLLAARGLNVVHAGDKSVNYIVRSGDTLWTIANQVGHAGNHTTDEVLRIIQVNHLSGASIQPGEHLIIPR